MQQTSERKRGRWAEWKVNRGRAFDRCGGWCEVCGIAIARNAFEAHHRKLRSQGGTNDVVNILVLCPGPWGCHHAKVHAHPEWSVQRGFIVPREQDPATTPALIAGQRGPVLLTATGYVPVRGAA